MTTTRQSIEDQCENLGDLIRKINLVRERTGPRLKLHKLARNLLYDNNPKIDRSIWRTDIQITIPSLNDRQFRINYYKGWFSEGTNVYDLRNTEQSQEFLVYETRFLFGIRGFGLMRSEITRVDLETGKETLLETRRAYT
ncbi:hypothetical protein CMI38_05255 [Candidatus Pacearchaeota archaeon]|nr:hypothetical protein [Candidatus Pacearchaeota archaeon]|tara:strand:- start:469 stop:888 length:420 start_codon:yes stop_codon:yes gene_type:complete